MNTASTACRSRPNRLLLPLIALAVAGSAALAAPQATAALPLEVSGERLPSLAPVIEDVSPAVVNIAVRGSVEVRNPFMEDPFFRRFFGVPEEGPGQRRRFQSAGSGVIVDAEQGYLLTNHHVIQNAEEITITLVDGRELKAEVVGSDRGSDIAVLKVDSNDLKAIRLADSDESRVGDFVVAIGNPFGLTHTVTSGIVSALGRSGLNPEGYEDFIQTDASINPGNSGGALIDLAGRLVGINTAIFTPSGGNVGIGFAIPASTALHVMGQLVEFGEVRRGSLGVAVQDMTGDLREALGVSDRQGAVITQVREGSALEQAGLRPGDVITRIDRRPVSNAQDLRNIEGLLAVGATVEVTYLRNGEAATATVTIAEDLDARISGRRLDERLDGVVLVRIPDRSLAQGALIEEVRRGSAAWDVGLRAGDVIVAVNRHGVRTLGELRGRFPVATDRELSLEIRRRGVAYLVLL